MGLVLDNLDDRTRRLMLDEMQLDIQQNQLNISPYLSGQGVRDYPNLLRLAIENGDDEALAKALKQQRRLLRSYTRRTAGGGYQTVSVPADAAQVIAEGQFNRYYIRAIARRAIEDQLPALIVVRAKPVAQPRPKSEQLLETALDPQELLEDLRTHPGEAPRLGVPAGPGSGLTVRLPD
jgi:hypothetical protein